MANCYIINYDLNKSHKDYNSLITAIKSYSNSVRILKSCWAVVTTKSAEQVRDHLLSFMDGDDGIFVLKSGREAAWKNVECSSQWLQNNL